MSYICLYTCMHKHILYIYFYIFFSKENTKTFTMELKAGSKHNLFCISPKILEGGRCAHILLHRILNG